MRGPEHNDDGQHSGAATPALTAVTATRRSPTLVQGASKDTPANTIRLAALADAYELLRKIAERIERRTDPAPEADAG